MTVKEMARNKKASRREILQMLSSMLLFIVVVACVYFGVSFLRGVLANRVYGKEQRKQIQALAREQNWESAAMSVEKSSERGDSSAVPEEAVPYLVILIPKHNKPSDNQMWKVLACSEKKPASLDGIRTVVFCKYTEKTAGYGPAGAGSATTTGRSEFVYISYVNAETGECYKWEKIGKELPGKASDAPNYKVSTNKLLTHIKKTLQEMNGQ